VTRWLQPPQLEWPRDPDRFDPVADGARYHHLSAELARAIWARVSEDATDGAGRCDLAQAQQRFHELAARVARRGGRLRPEVGRVTRVDHGTTRDRRGWCTDELDPRAPGRDTQVLVEARRVRLPTERPDVREAARRGSDDAWTHELVAGAADTARRNEGAADQATPGTEPALPARTARSTSAPVPVGPPAWLPRAASPWDPPAAPSSGMPGFAPTARTPASLQLQSAAAGAPGALDDARVREAAAEGLSGPSGPLPHVDRIQRSFGRHDVTGVRAHVGGVAAQVSDQIGALAYAAGRQVAFRDSPDLHLAAHEAAHIIQQRAGVQLSGGVGAAGDPYERHADAVADLVVAGHSAEALLDHHAAGGGSSSGAVQLTQNPDSRRESRVSVATSVQAYRVTYPDAHGGLLTQALLAQLRTRRTSVADAVSRTGEGGRQLGAAPASGEERAGTSLGASAPVPASSHALRRAVVIGNGAYNPGTHMGSTVEPTRPLPNSPRDAAAIGGALSGRGYTVTSLTNQTAAQIDTALRTQLTGLGAGSEIVFFFSGHGTPEGLIGSDGQAFTPAQALALRTQARQLQVDLTFATDACHAGIFADAIRGAELADTRAAARRGAGAGTAGSPGAAMVSVLDAAIALQAAKDTYNTTMRQWWARRYELEVPINAGNTSDAVMNPWTTHYNLGAAHWNTFVVAANLGLVTLHATATAAGHALRPLTLTPLGATYDNTGEMAVQAGLDDVDTLTNEVLTFANGQLPP